MSLIEKLKDLPGLPFEAVPGTTLGADAFVREFSGDEFDRAIEWLDTERKAEGDGGDTESLKRSEIIALALCDSKGAPAINFKLRDERKLVAKLGLQSVNKLWAKVAELNGLANPPQGEKD